MILQGSYIAEIRICIELKHIANLLSRIYSNHTHTVDFRRGGSLQARRCIAEADSSNRVDLTAEQLRVGSRMIQNWTLCSTKNLEAQLGCIMTRFIRSEERLRHSLCRREYAI
jgi:hypothetical protein